MNNWLAIIIAVFATYRLATDFAWMDGPYGAYAKLRGGITVRFGATSWIAEGSSCPICWSWWLALIATLFLSPLDWAFVLYWLGIAGAVAFLVRFAGGAE